MLRKRVKKETRDRIRAKDGKLNVIGPRIRQLRRGLSPKVSQEDLAGRLASLGVPLDRTAVNKIERRQRMVSDVEIVAIARSLKTFVAKLFEPTEG